MGSRPRTSTQPDVGSSKPSKQLSSVVLPAPLGPMIPKISFSYTSRKLIHRSRPQERFPLSGLALSCCE